MEYGSSLIVPSVKELAKEPMTIVPPRYIRSDQHDQTINKIVSSSEIPVVDFQRLISEKSKDSELIRLHLASKDWGFFQLVNHGVSLSLVEKVKREVQDFYKLPMEEKKKFWQKPEDVEGFGQAFVVSEEQKLDWNDMFFITAQPLEKRKPHLFPKLPSSFRDTLETYSLELQNLAKEIIRQMEKALGIDQSKEIRDLFEDGIQSMRMNYYPPCPHSDKVIGLTPHSDGVGLTILLQVNDVEALQVKKCGMWVPVKPLPNAFIVNIGDMLEIVTNGNYRSIEHRATVDPVKERLSIATFYFPNAESEFGPASSLITEQTPALYKRLTVAKFFEGFFSRKLDGKSYVETVKFSQA